MDEEKKSTSGDENFKRRMDISRKIMDMGISLNEEGKKSDCYEISSAGNVMMLLAGLILDGEDIKLFSNICSMFSAKKVMDTIPTSNIFGGGDLPTRLEDIINKINKDDTDDGDDS